MPWIIRGQFRLKLELTDSATENKPPRFFERKTGGKGEKAG